MSRILPSALLQSSGSSKRKHSSVDTSNEIKSTKQSFSGCRIVIQCGSNIATKRRSLWAQAITQRGGDVVDSIDKKTTHCILPTPFDYQTFHQSLKSSLKQKYIDRIHFHTDDWLVQSIKANKLIDESMYAITFQSQDELAIDSHSQSSSQSYSQSHDRLPDLEPSTQSSISSQDQSISQSIYHTQSINRTISDLNASPMSLPPLEFPSPAASPVKSVNHSVPRSGHSGGGSGRISMNSITNQASSQSSVSRALFEPSVKKEEPAWNQSSNQLIKRSPSIAQQSDDEIEWLIDPSVINSSMASSSYDPNNLFSQPLKRSTKRPMNTDYLACQKSSSSLINHNAAITQVFERLEQMNAAIGEKWKEMSYRKAVGIIKQYPKKIEGEEDFTILRKSKGISAKFIDKMKEIIRTGTMQKVEVMQDSDLIKTLELFTGIHGVGSVTARKWYDKGLRTLEELVSDPRVELSAQQKVGLRFYHDKAQRIPRTEVQAIEQFVWLAADSLMSGIQVMCCGSYRRGKPASGDCDLLITHELFTDDVIGNARRSEFLNQLMRKLKSSIEPPYTWLTSDINTGAVGQIYEMDDHDDDEYAHGPDDADQSTNHPINPIVKQSSEASQKMKQLKNDLPSSFDPFITGVLADFDGLTARHAQGTFMGFCRLPLAHPRYSGVHRRLDMKVYPRSMFPFALLYFTGSDHFNRSMRFYAKKCGWSLSDHGLARVNRVNGSKVMSGDSVCCETEKDIFRAMGLRYIPPTERNTYQAWEEAMGLNETDRLAIKAEDGGPSDTHVQHINDDASSQTSEANLQPEDFYEDRGYTSDDQHN